MDQFFLNRGSKQINLTKSSHLIGLRGREDLERLVIKLPDNLIRRQQFLGGFEVFEVQETKEVTERILDELRIIHPEQTGTHLYHMNGEQAAYAPTGKIAVRFSSGLPEAIQQEFHLKLIRRDRLTDTFIYCVTVLSPNPLKVSQALQRRPEILLAEADLSVAAELCTYTAPIDIYFKEQWHLCNTGTMFGQTYGLKLGADARVVPAWKAAGFGISDCVIAVIDDGFDLTHPDLSDPARIRSPFNFETKTTDPSPQYFTPRPGDIHGTATAGLAIGAATGQCIAGVAPGCSFMPLRWSRNLNDDSIINWFAHARDQGAWVINCSWTGPKGYTVSTLQQEAIKDCATKGRQGRGCVIVFSAGNHAAPTEGFATLSEVIVVSACTSNDDFSSISSFGLTVTVCAPSEGIGGRKIVTANVKGMVLENGVNVPRGYNDADEDYTADFGGTSASAPIVAGVCGLILSVAPHLTAVQIKKVLTDSARRIGPKKAYKNGRSDNYGYGCVNAGAAVALAMKL